MDFIQGGGQYGADLYTGIDAENFIRDIQAQYRSDDQDKQDDKKKKEDDKDKKKKDEKKKSETKDVNDKSEEVKAGGEEVITLDLLLEEFFRNALPLLKPFTLVGVSAISLAGSTIFLTSDTREQTADELLPGSVKRSPSYNPKYGDKTRSELERLAKKGDQAAAKMKKLVDQSKRLQQKNKNPNK